MTNSRRWVLALLMAGLAFTVTLDTLQDAPYRFLTGFTQHELQELAYLPGPELERRIGLREVPGGFTGTRGFQGRAAHAIASYLGTRRWGPDVTLACGYMREYVPWLLGQKDADPIDIAANYAGVAQALRDAQRQP